MLRVHGVGEPWRPSPMRSTDIPEITKKEEAKDISDWWDYRCDISNFVRVVSFVVPEWSTVWGLRHAITLVIRVMGTRP